MLLEKNGDLPGWAKPWPETFAAIRRAYSALEPHCDKFKRVYKPIRHKYFAHRANLSQQAIDSLFGQTLIGDASQILRVLHMMLHTIREMAWNARRPDLTDFSDFEQYVQRVNRKTEEFIRALP